jgi:hypothetical protein
MDEEYVQEHILTGGIVGPVGGASPTHSWPLTAISLGVVTSYPTHLRRAPHSAHAWSALRMAARIAAGEALGQRARLLVGGLRQTVADAAMLGVTDCENIGCAGDEMIVDDDAAIDRTVDVSLGKSARRRQHGFEIAKTVDHNAQRRHQLAALFRHIAA